MCGIVGFSGRLSFKKDVIHNMMDLMIHRGPNSDGYYTDDEMALMAKANHDGRLAALEEKAQSAEKAEALLSAQVQAVSDRGDFVEDCLAEMACVVYA